MLVAPAAVVAVVVAAAVFVAFSLLVAMVKLGSFSRQTLPLMVPVKAIEKTLTFLQLPAAVMSAVFLRLVVLLHLLALLSELVKMVMEMLMLETFSQQTVLLVKMAMVMLETFSQQTFLLVMAT